VQRTPGPGGTRADQIPPSLEGRPKERRHEVRVYTGKVTDVPTGSENSRVSHCG
jgi:hypothetical protein